MWLSIQDVHRQMPALGMLGGNPGVCFLQLTGPLDSEREEEVWCVYTSPPFSNVFFFPVGRGFDSFSKFLLSTFYVPGTGLGVGNTAVNQLIAQGARFCNKQIVSKLHPTSID